jgi:hypothetical protein
MEKNLPHAGMVLVCHAKREALFYLPERPHPWEEGDIQPGLDRAISPVLPRLTSVNVEHCRPAATRASP